MPEIMKTKLSGVSSPIVKNNTAGIWVERYRRGGEFSLTLSDPEYAMEALPLDSLVTHKDTYEVMVVEDYVIEESKKTQPFITVTGRSLDEVLLSNRKRTVNDPGGVYTIGDYPMAVEGAGYIFEDWTLDWYGAYTIIKDFLIDGIEHPRQIVDNLAVYAEYAPLDTGLTAQDWAWYNLDSAYSAVQQLLATQDLGLRVARPFGNYTTMDLIIYQGRDRGDGNAVLSTSLGDIESARYLFSNRGDLTAMYMQDGTIVSKLFTDGGDGVTTREGSLDMSNLRLPWPEDPLTDIPLLNEAYIKFQRAGSDSIQDNKKLKMVEPEISDTASITYGKDYLMGDVVQVIGNYGVIDDFRVVEHAITWDANGSQSIPTLAQINI